MAGVRFCLDICLDHARGVCAAALDKEKEQGSGPGHVQVQLIVSAGMSIEPKNTRVSAGGSVLRLIIPLAYNFQTCIERFRPHTQTTSCVGTKNPSP